METHKGIQGFSIQNLSADPSDIVDGQLWYNSTDSVFKYNKRTIFTGWVSGGNMNTARQQHAGAGTQTAGLAFGGETPPPTTNLTEEYDGSAWTTGGAM